MSDNNDSERLPYQRVQDIPRILQEMHLAVQEALARHKQAGNPVAVWRDGQVAWVAPADIPSDPLSGPE